MVIIEKKVMIIKLIQKLNSRRMINKSEKSKQEEQYFAKTTTGDEEKRYRMIKKLTSHNPQAFRDVNITQFDFNITENFEELESIDDAVTPLIYCAYFGFKEMIKQILKHPNIDIDQQTNNNRQTPLIVACMSGNYEIMRILVLANAQINKPNSLNHSALAVTLFRLVEEPGSFENRKICFRMAQFLVDHGADINWIIDKNKGYSLLHYFCSSKMKMNKLQKQLNYEIIRFLLQKGANPNQLTLQDKTVFQLLSTHCNKERLIELIETEKHTANEIMMEKIPKFEVKKLGEGYFQREKM